MDYNAWLSWECLVVPPDEIEEVAWKMEVWASLHKAAVHTTQPQISGKKMDGWLHLIV